MPRFQLPVSYKAPGSDREVQLRLYNHVYVFTTTASTQTDSEVFFVNGKPAMAVYPFRVVPKKPKKIVSQMAELEQALEGQAVYRETPALMTRQEIEEQALEGQAVYREMPGLITRQEVLRRRAQQQRERQQREQQQFDQQQFEQQQFEQQQFEQQQFEQQQFEQQLFEQQQFEQQQFEQQQFEQLHFEQQEVTVPLYVAIAVQERQSRGTQTDMELFYEEEATDAASASEDSNPE